MERYDPDLWTDEFAFLNQPGQADIQSDLFYDYRTNVDAYPKWQAWMREKQPRLLVIWGKYDLSFDLSEPEAYRRDVPKAEVHVLDAGHFALDTEVVDLTSLQGGYDFTLEYTRELPLGFPDGGKVNGEDPDTSGPTVFAAVKQQLGLELKAQKGPVEVIVIDHAEKPSAN